MNYSSRLDKLRQSVASGKLDGLIYGIGANLRYFTGLPLAWRRESEPAEPGCLLLVTQAETPRVILDRSLAGHAADLPEGVEADVYESPTELTGLLARRLRDGSRIGIGRPAESYLRSLVGAALPGAECVPAEDLGEAQRVIKDADEIAIMRRVVTLTDQVMGRVVDHIRPGITQPALRAMIEEAGLALGAEDVSFPPAGLFVKSGSEPTPDPFVYPQDKGLVPGSSIAFDFGFVLDGYCSDFGRSFYCGPAPRHISGAYRALQEAQCELIGQMGPGRLALGELFGVIEWALDDRGYGDRLRARLPEGNVGHQIGVDLHENPWLRRGSEVMLQPGMVMAIEPKVWLAGEYYLRVEDIVLITESGAESLTQYDRELFELPV
jgi:Xaa-Pro aminopeptidase